MPPVAIAAVAGGALVGTTVGQYMSGREQAKAQGRAAEAQLTEQQQQRMLALQAANPTINELENIGRNLSLAERTLRLQDEQLNRDRRLIEAVDPAILETAKQALELLQGKEARTLDPIRGQRDRQRRELESRLRAQLGPGYQTSSAGIQALSRFDEDTANVIAQAQESSTNNLLGATLRARPDVLGQIFQGGNLVGNLNQSVFGAQNTIANRQISAINQTSLTPYAGAPFVEANSRAQATGNLYAGIGGIAERALGYGLGGMSGSGAAASSAGAYAGGYKAPTGYTLGANTDFGTPRY